jgi:hypothetical protein
MYISGAENVLINNSFFVFIKMDSDSELAFGW